MVEYTSYLPNLVGEGINQVVNRSGSLPKGRLAAVQVLPWFYSSTLNDSGRRIGIGRCTRQRYPTTTGEVALDLLHDLWKFSKFCQDYLQRVSYSNIRKDHSNFAKTCMDLN